MIAGRRTVEVLVVGGGPAGSTIARQLRLNGHDVSVLDRATFPRPKPCGESINPGAVAALERLGLLDAVLAAGPSRIGGWCIADQSGRRASGSFRDHHALGIPRERLDLALLEATRASGADVYENTRVQNIDRTRDGWAVITHGPADTPVTWNARVLIGADGLRSIVSRRLGLISRRPTLRKTSMTFRIRGVGPAREWGRLTIAGGTTIGLAPVDGGRPLWNCTVVVPSGERTRQLAADPWAFVTTALTHDVAWRDGPTLVAGPWTSGPFDWPVRHTVTDGAMLIGDAAGYFDPLTGQGVYRALRSAELAARVLHDALARGEVTRHFLAPYERQLRRELAVPRLFQRAVEAVLGTPILRAPALRILGRSRRLTSRLVGIAGDTPSVPSLVRPDPLPRPMR